MGINRNMSDKDYKKLYYKYKRKYLKLSYESKRGGNFFSRATSLASSAVSAASNTVSSAVSSASNTVSSAVSSASNYVRGSSNTQNRSNEEIQFEIEMIKAVNDKNLSKLEDLINQNVHKTIPIYRKAFFLYRKLKGQERRKKRIKEKHLLKKIKLKKEEFKFRDDLEDAI